tara:strand:+ start:581 stop:814 length:234 start_codon:yes stop_codon:yes gene_type:complete
VETKQFKNKGILSMSTTNPKEYLNGSYVNFEHNGKRSTGFVSEVFDEGFSVDMVVHDDKTFPLHNTDYTIFVKEAFA